MTSHNFDPKLTPFPPLSCQNGYFTYTFKQSFTKSLTPPPPYLGDIIYEWSLIQWGVLSSIHLVKVCMVVEWNVNVLWNPETHFRFRTTFKFQNRIGMSSAYFVTSSLKLLTLGSMLFQVCLVFRCLSGIGVFGIQITTVPFSPWPKINNLINKEYLKLKCSNQFLEIIFCRPCEIFFDLKQLWFK